jgi:hypothetical protein
VIGSSGLWRRGNDGSLLFQKKIDEAHDDDVDDLVGDFADFVVTACQGVDREMGDEDDGDPVIEAEREGKGNRIDKTMRDQMPPVRTLRIGQELGLESKVAQEMAGKDFIENF